MDLNNKTIIISRTDSIGDVILTLPITGYLRSLYPQVRIVFLGRNYTQPVIECCKHVDTFLEWNDELSDENLIEQIANVGADIFIHVFPKSRIARLAKKAKVKKRIGVSHRLYHFLYCNSLPGFTRKNSELHEAQLNFKLLPPLGIANIPKLEEIPTYYGWQKTDNQPVNELIDPNRLNIILHPKSQGSAVEWGLDNFAQLVNILDASKFKIFISGTSKEKELMGDAFEFNEDVVDLRGAFDLSTFIHFIGRADGLIAASTGPLHIAAASGIHALGLFSPRRPIHPGRWAPLGKNADYLVHDENCVACQKGNDCNCIQQITPERVLEKISQFEKTS